MTLHFYLRYHTSFGQALFITGNVPLLGDGSGGMLAMEYLDEETWHVKIETGKKDKEVSYRYILKEEGKTGLLDADTDRHIILADHAVKELFISDVWNDEGATGNIFYTRPFREILLPRQKRSPKLKEAKTFTHEFRVKAPLVGADEWVCISGSGRAFREWDLTKLAPLKQSGNWHVIKVNLSKESFPLRYKYGIYNTAKKTFLFEEGADRILRSPVTKKQQHILHDGFIHMQADWRGTGVAVPVFSLRSRDGFGCGEFTDIKLLVDWAKQAGIKLLQFLPVNDTTATHSDKDSYPYKAISAFALHPILINLEAVAGPQQAGLVRSLSKKKKDLNSKAGLDYGSVMKFKLSCLKEIFHLKKDCLRSESFTKYFDENREWLVPYAAYCYLRDKHGTADFTQWRSNSIYNKENIQKLVLASQPQYEEIAFHYFVQYHLHLQLKEASAYAHEKGIILKGDIPIGVSRNSCDVWVDPSLYYLDEQAGAPPDDFAVKGQNWGFPTYNWKAMQRNGFAWWRKRFEQMDRYFDSFRIDHILGFFRIWSIPVNQVEGVMGRFVPAIPVHITEFHRDRIWFDQARYCKPYITEEILTGIFGERKEEVKEKFIDTSAAWSLKEEFDTQRKIDAYFEESGDKELMNGLFNLVSNVILFPEADDPAQFHFRIAMQGTSSFRSLDPTTQQQLTSLYNNYFYSRQEELWKQEALQKLPALKRSTNMLICGEDLGMVPHCVPEVMKQTGILSLEIQRMPKDPSVEFFHPRTAPYLSVVTPSTHDMSTVREWWEEDKEVTQRFFNFIMGRYGKAPEHCSTDISTDIILQHIYSPAMWCIFQLQDLLGMSEKLRRKDPFEERINLPSDPNHFWNYRMHITLEELNRERSFNKSLRNLIEASGRS